MKFELNEQEGRHPLLLSSQAQARLKFVKDMEAGTLTVKDQNDTIPMYRSKGQGLLVVNISQFPQVWDEYIQGVVDDYKAGPSKEYNFRKKMWNRITQICEGRNKKWFRDGNEMVLRENTKNRYPIPGIWLDVEANKKTLDQVEGMNESSSSESVDDNSTPIECTAFPASSGSQPGPPTRISARADREAQRIKHDPLGTQVIPWTNRYGKRRPQIIMTTHGLMCPNYHNQRCPQLGPYDSSSKYS